MKIKSLFVFLIFILIACENESEKLVFTDFVDYKYIDVTESVLDKNLNSVYVDTIWFYFDIPDTLRSIRHYYNPDKPNELVKKDTTLRRFIIEENEILNGTFNFQLNQLLPIHSNLLDKRWIIKENLDTEIILDAYSNDIQVMHNKRLIKLKR